MPEILRANTAGFCMGVDLALRKLNTQVKAEDQSSIFTFGPIIHNPQVLAHYAAQGVCEANTPSDIPANSRAVIRAHGIPRFLEDQLRTKGVVLVDATCPKVKKAQLLIEKETSQGRHLLLFGESDHPEVKGLLWSLTPCPNCKPNDCIRKSTTSSLRKQPKTAKNFAISGTISTGISTPQCPFSTPSATPPANARWKPSASLKESTI